MAKPEAERAWIAKYERIQSEALGDPNYHLPTKDELLAEHRERDRKRGHDRQER